MKNLQDLQLVDYLAILRQRMLWILCCGVTVGVATHLYVRTLPNIYRSETVILIEPQKVPSDYVRATSTGTIESRLSTISQQIKSRTRLERIIQENNLYPDVRMKQPMDSVIEIMRNDIHLAVTKSDAFSLSYQSQNPSIAQRIASQVASLYIEENLKAREAQNEGVNEFLDVQLKETKAKLLEFEARLSSFKMNHIGSLPEQQQANLAVLGGLQQQLQASIESTNRLEDQKGYQQRLQAELKSLSNLGKGTRPTHLENSAMPLAIQKPLSPLGLKIAELSVLQQRYTSEHPDVRKLKAEIALLEQQEVVSGNDPGRGDQTTSSTQASAAAQASQANLEAMQVKKQLEALDRQIKQGVKEQERIRSNMATFQARVDNVPRIEQLQKEISRDYDITREHYQKLLAKKNEAEMAGSLEKRQKGEQFRIIDPASFPQKPIRPDRLKLNVLGILAGLGLGFGLALLFELRDESIRNTQQLTQLTKYPVLAVISVISTPTQNSMRGPFGTVKRRIQGILR